MTLDELITKLPPELKPLATQYGPTLLAMGITELQQWLDYVFVGRYTDAYALVLKASTADELLDEWTKLEADWKAANEANAEKMELSKQIAFAVCKAILSIVLVLVGL